MFSFARKFVAVLLAIWLPLFSGNALAVSVAMQMMCGDCCPAVAQQEQHASATRQHAQSPALVAHQDQSAGDCDQHNNHQDQRNPTHDKCGVCQLACCGYMATAEINATEAPPLALSFTPALTQFQSATSTPLDPPPLARA